MSDECGVMKTRSFPRNTRNTRNSAKRELNIRSRKRQRPEETAIRETLRSLESIAIVHGKHGSTGINTSQRASHS